MKRELILASQSPRRRELLERCHVPFRIEVADIDEALNPDIPLEAAMEELAWRKAHTVFERHPEAVVIGADTIVVLERVCFCDVSDVEFYPLTAEEIDAYVATGEPLDKAGAYGIQGEGFFLAKKITGDFYSIMGFPVARVLRALKKFDF